METMYEKIKKIFRKNEQICIYGIDWETNGYITKIEKDGITLTKISNTKAIKYNWNCFEVICHAGYKVWKSKPTEVTDIFQFKIASHLPRIEEIKTLIKEVKSTKITTIQIIDDPLYFSTYLKLLPKEIKPGFYIYKGKYWFKNGAYINFNINGKQIITYKDASELDIKIDKELNINELQREGIKVNENFKTKFSEEQIIIYPPKQDIIFSPLYVIQNKRLDFEFKKEGYYSIPFTNEGIIRVRQNKWNKRTTGIGDPYIFEGEPVNKLTDKIWKGTEGYLLSNHYADIYI